MNGKSDKKWIGYLSLPIDFDKFNFFKENLLKNCVIRPIDQVVLIRT